MVAQAGTRSGRAETEAGRARGRERERGGVGVGVGVECVGECMQWVRMWELERLS